MDPMIKTCTKCSARFETSPIAVSVYEKLQVPLPSLCDLCRFKRRALFRNETALYTRTCSLCNKSMVSMYSPKSPYIVYCQECWHSDKWDPRKFGAPYDESRAFLDQLQELFLKVPKAGNFITAGLGPNTNSDFANVAGGLKNCYMVFNTGLSEEVLYSRGLKDCRDSSDLYYGVNNERCYEGVNTQQSAGVMYGQNVTGCVDSWFMMNASGCQNCFGCVNVRNKSYYFLNQPMSKEEYAEKVMEIKGSYEKIEEFKKKFAELVLKSPHRENANLKTVNVSGNYLFESKNLSNCFEAVKCEDSANLFSVKECKDSSDVAGYGYSSELLLECVATGVSQRILGSFGVETSEDVMYSIGLRKSRNCIGCDSLNGADYSILNHSYSKEEYERLKKQIIAELTASGDYGLSFPPSLVPFAYNECVAQDNVPLTKEEALSEGFRWQDELQVTTGKTTLRAANIPDQIKDVEESIIKEVLECMDCKRNYRIIPQELAFYRRMNLPIPRLCFYCRHQERIKKRGPLQVFDRNCDHCNKAITTTFAPARPEKVYCESCYQQEVV